MSSPLKFPAAGIQQVSIAEEKNFGGRPFPLTLSPSEPADSPGATLEQLVAWISSNRDEVDDLLRDYCGILFRGFPVGDHNDLHRVIEATGYLGMPYIGGAAVRTQLTDRVFTANESPSSEKIPFHHEMAQTPSPPTHLFFYCETPPAAGGETPILISAEVVDRLAAQSAARAAYISHLESVGVRYTRVMPEVDDPTSAIGRGWKSTFNCTDRAGAEESLRQLGSSWEWLDGAEGAQGGDLRTLTATVPAIVTDNKGSGRRSNRRTFFNSMVAAYTGWTDSRNEGRKAVQTGDGGVIQEDFMDAAVAVMEDVCVAFRWQRGDVLLLDNRTTMHSRRPFEGQRRVLAGLARDPDR